MKHPKTTAAAWGAVALFVLARLWILFDEPSKLTDTTLYAFYGFVTAQAKAHTSPYDHYESVRRSMLAATDGASLTLKQKTIEYPPLALGLFRAIAQLVPEYPKGSGVRGNGPNDRALWLQNFRRLYFAADVLTLLGVAWWLRRRGLGSPWGLFVGTVGGLLLAFVLYDRLDLWLGLLLLGAIASLISGRRYWAMALLAVGVNLKLVPILLFPLFVLGAQPAARRSLRAALASCAVFVGAGLAVFLPFRLGWGPRVWDAFVFHGERGLEIETLWSSVLLLASYVGYPAKVVSAFGSCGIEGPGAQFLAKATTYVVLATTAGVTWLYWRSMARAKPTREEAEESKMTWAEQEPQRFVWASFALLALAMAGSKVFSPQYVCWLLPMFLLVEAPRNWRAALQSISFLVACLLTMMVFPHLWPEMERILTLSPLVLGMPTLRVILVSLARNLIWIGFAVAAVLAMQRRLEPENAVAANPRAKAPRAKPKTRAQRRSP